MSNIFQPEVADIQPANFRSDKVVDTTAAKTIGAVGGTVWEAAKGKELAQFAGQGDWEVDEQPQVLLGENAASTTDGSTKIIRGEMGLQGLKDAVSQGLMTQRAANAKASAKAAELINRIPGLQKEIVSELSLFSSNGLGLGGGKSGSSSKPQTAEEAQAKGYLDLVEEGVKYGWNAEQMAKHKQQMANLQMQAALDTSRQKSAEDAAGSLGALSMAQMNESLAETLHKFRTGEMKGPEAELLIQTGMQRAITSYQQKMIAIMREPGNELKAGEYMTAMQAQVEKMTKWGELLASQSPQAAQAILVDAHTMQTELEMRAEPAFQVAEAMAKIDPGMAGQAHNQMILNPNSRIGQGIARIYGQDVNSKQVIGNAQEIIARNLINLADNDGQIVEPPAPVPGLAGKKLNSMLVGALDSGMSPKLSDAAAAQLVANLGAADDDGLLVDAISKKPDNYLKVSNDSNKQVLIDNMRTNIVNAITEMHANYKGYWTGQVKTNQAINMGRIYDPDAKFVNMLAIWKKNPEVFGDTGEMVDIVMEQSRAYGIPDEIMQARLEKAGLSMPETSSEAPGEPKAAEPTPTPKEEPTSTQMPVEEIYQRLARSETGGQEDPFIRTKVIPKDGEPGSSAYGPVQITRGLARGVVRYHSDKFDEEELKYLERFIAQGDLFLKYGRRPDLPGYNARYDYGGVGDLTSPADRKMYDRIAAKIIQIELDASGGDVESFIKRWRGADPEGDYLKRFYAELA